MAGHAIVEADIPQVFFPGTPPSIRFDFPRKRALPKLLPCRFVIRLSSSGSEGRNRPEKFVHHHFFNIEWLEDKNFLDCVEKGMRFLNRTVNAREHVYRNSLQYRVLRQLPNLITKRRRTFSWSENMTAQYPELEAYPEEEVYAESIDKDGQWHERLPPRLTEEMRADRDSTLFLELVLSCTKYTPHSPNHCSNHNCAAEIRQILDSERVSVKTPPGAWFVSARFLDNFFTPVLISHLIEQDTALNQDDDWLRAMHESKESIQAQFVMDVNQWFIHLLASCIYAKVSLRCLYHLWRAEKLDEDIPLSDHWIPPGVDKPDYENYVRYQGNFRANRFQDPSQPQKHQVIKHGVVIPLTEDSPLDKGSFGEVRRVQIHGDYHGFTPNRDELFALKRILPRSHSRNVQHESEILQKLAKVPHEHLTPLLASWYQEECCSILLPLAQQNLQAFLRQPLQPDLNGKFVLWLLDQMKGLAAAIKHIHYLGPADLNPTSARQGGNVSSNRDTTGYHHDLKPQNILVFRNNDTSKGPVLKVSDFGTARLQQVVASEVQQGISHQTSNVICDENYAPPEYFLTHRASRPHDVWSLGCIFLEMLVWAFDNGSEVNTFYQERLDEGSQGNLQSWCASFFYQNGKNPDLKLAVKDRLKNLKARENAHHVFETIVDLIEIGMLRPHPKDRLRMSDVESELEKMRRQAALDLDEYGDDYFLKKKVPEREQRPLYGQPPSLRVRVEHSPSEGTRIEPTSPTPGLLSPHPQTPHHQRRYSTGYLLPRIAMVPSHKSDFPNDLARAGYQFPDDAMRDEKWFPEM